MPVIVLLIYFFIRALILIGVFFGQYLNERRTSALLDSKVKTIAPAEVLPWIESLPENGAPVVLALHDLAANRANGPRMDMIVNEYELAADTALSTSRILTKMGPILGLMGTLIPMGPALVGLATGDIASMAYNMQVAFATTVVGLVVSAIGFVTQQARERWAMRHVAVLDFVAQTLKESEK